ncbi:hypothetical protein D3C77_660650 [compost metagenome]
MRSVVKASEPVPVNGRKIPRGKISEGTENFDNNGVSQPTKKSSAPEALNTLIATIIPTRWGKILMAVEKPSLAPSTKDS